jgi:prepilin-type N-terminal cleavage/methylation domain-containing protein
MRQGFSLVELMVCIAIIALLLAIALPTLALARARGRQAVCVHNLQQLAIAARQYAADYDGTLPLTSHSGSESAWLRTLQGYGIAPAQALCPDDPLRGRRQQQGGTSYAWNEQLLSELAAVHDAGGRPQVAYLPAPSLELLACPTQTLLLLEQSAASGTDPRGDHIHNRAWKRFPERLCELLQSDLALTRHPGGTLATCADGHLQHFPPGALEAQARQGTDPLQIPL